MTTVRVEFPMPENRDFCKAPYWMIIDPGHRCGCAEDYEGYTIDDLTDREVAYMVTGPFFSREEADKYLAAHKKYFTPKAVVWSLFGKSMIYVNAWRKADEVMGNAREWDGFVLNGRQ